GDLRHVVVHHFSHHRPVHEHLKAFAGNDGGYHVGPLGIVDAGSAEFGRTGVMKSSVRTEGDTDSGSTIVGGVNGSVCGRFEVEHVRAARLGAGRYRVVVLHVAAHDPFVGAGPSLTRKAANPSLQCHGTCDCQGAPADVVDHFDSRE